jgi:hypothetical protein
MNDPALVELPTAPAAKKQPNRQRSNVERFRTDDAEHAELVALAHDSGLSFGAFMRASTIGNPGPRSRRRPPTPDGKLIARFGTEVNRIGGNLNQGFRALNEIALSAPAAVERDRLAYELEALRKLFRTALDEISPTLAAAREALGYDRQG